MAKRRHYVLPHSSVVGKKPSVYNASSAPAGVMKSELAVNIANENEFLATQNVSGNIVTWWPVFEKGNSDNTFVKDSVIASNGTLKVQNVGEVALGYNNTSSQESASDKTTWNNNSGTTLFSIGNGADTANTSNAFEVRRDGTTIVGGNLNVVVDGEMIDVVKLIVEDEKVTSAALNDLNTRKADRTEIPDVSGYFDSVSYDSTEKKIFFYNDNVQKGYVDATAFIKDGMVDSVTVKDVEISGETVKCLVITFNTDSGKEDINIPIKDIFDSNLYYTKTECDNLFGKVDDVLVNNVSVVTNKVATIPTATTSEYGVVIVDTELDSASTNPVSNAAITNEILDNELIVSSALVDLDERISEHSSNTLVHVTSEEKEAWNSKQGSLEYYTEHVQSRTATLDNGSCSVELDSLDGGTVVINATHSVMHDESNSFIVGGGISANTNNNDKFVYNGNEVVTKADIASSTDYGLVVVDEELDNISTNPVTNAAVSKMFEKVEKVTAAALNDLEERKQDALTIDTELDSESQNPVTNAAITSMFEKEEEVIAASLNDLDERLTISSINIENLESETSKLNTIIGPNDVTEFNISTFYLKGDFVMYDGKLYKFTENHAAGEWDDSQVIETNLFSEIEYMTKNDYEEVVITLQNESGTPLPDVLVAVHVEGENSARNFTSDTYGMCTTNVSKGLDYTVSANNVEGYYPTTPISRRASLPKRYVNVTYVVDDTLTQEHLQVTLSYSNTALTTASYVTVSYGGTDYQISVVNNVAETDIPLGTVYQVSFEEINGYRTPNVRTFTAEHHGTRPINVRYQAPVSGIKWLMTNNTERELNAVSNEERLNGEIFGLIVETSDLVDAGCEYVIPLDILMKSASKTGAWMSVNEEISQMGNYGSHTAALADKNGEENCQKILNYISGSSKTSSMVSGCKNMVGGAPTFSTANTYNVGEYVIYSGNLYTFIVQHEPGAFNVDETSGPMKGYLMPDGVVRQCFSPAYCQLWRFKENNAQVSAFTDDEFKLQCINVATDSWWSSSQYNATNGVRLSGGSFNSNSKANTDYLLPVLAY